MATGLSALAAMGAALLTACTGAVDPPPASAARPIVGGQVSAADDAVVAVSARRVTCQDTATIPTCTGILIAADVVLTAAHCVSVQPVARAYEVYFGPQHGIGGEYRLVVDHAVHPDYQAATFQADAALLRLDRPAPPGVVPVPASGTPLGASAIGMNVRVVGYGQTADDSIGPGTRMEGTGTVSAVDEAWLTYVPGPSMSCHGDSGGPVFAGGLQGEVLVAIASHGDPTCATEAINLRLDPIFAGFVQPYLDLSPPPTPEPTVRADAICSQQCASDADCPHELRCAVDLDGSSRCHLLGLPAADLGAACESDDDCAADCLRVEADLCRCATACAPVLDDGGGSCRVSGSGGGCLLLVAALLSRIRRRCAAGPASGHQSLRSSLKRNGWA